MTSWICIHIIAVIIWWYICTGSLMMISLLVVKLSWKMLLFHLQRNKEGRLGHPVTSSMTSSSWKYFYGHNLGRSFHFWGQIEAVFNISKFSKWPLFWARDKHFYRKLYLKLNRPERWPWAFPTFELLIDALAQILTEIYHFQNLTYFVTWWRHGWRH